MSHPALRWPRGRDGPFGPGQQRYRAQASSVVQRSPRPLTVTVASTSIPLTFVIKPKQRCASLRNNAFFFSILESAARVRARATARYADPRPPRALLLPYPHPTQPYARERNAHPRPFTIPTASLSRHSVKLLTIHSPRALPALAAAL